MLGAALSPAAPAPQAAAGEAQQALRKAVAFHRLARDMTLRFRAVTYNPDLDKRDSYQGKLVLKDSTRFRLETPGGTYVSDGVTFWEYHPQNRQVVIRSARDAANNPPGEVLLRFLDSDPLSLEKVKAGGKEYLKLRLDPSRAMKNLDSLAVLLNPSDYSVHTIGSRDASGNETEYTLVSVKRNAGVKDKVFVFQPPKGADVVDMRE